MPYKMTDDGQIAMGDNNLPIYIYPDGKEVGLDADSMIKTISTVNAESKARRLQLEENANAMKALTDAGISPTPEKIAEFVSSAMKNKTMVSNFAEKDFIEAGKVEEIKAQAIKNVQDSYERKMADQAAQFQAKENDYNSKFESMDSINRKLLVESEFKGSKFLADEVATPWEFIYNTYKDRFNITKTETGEHIVRATREDGSDIMSLSKPGNFASPAEAIEILVREHPQRENFLKGFQSGGTGTYQGSNGGRKINNSDHAAFSANLEDIASGRISVDMN